ncbi:MAG: TIGR03364 family FAD-dependent oxidoreductase [Steroidobacterales bacterium]
MTRRRAMFDLAVVGAGIIGLSCALAAVRRGLSVVVLERGARAVGASLCNFGFVTVTGQDRDTIWPRARRSREIWRQVADEAGIAIHQRGLWLAAQRPEAAAVLDAFMRTDMAEGCELLDAATARQRCPQLQTAGLQAVLTSPHELRVESREAVPRIAAWLAEAHGVEFRWNTAVHTLDDSQLDTSRGRVSANAVAVCPGDDLTTLFPERLAAFGVSRCRLQMLRLHSPGFKLPATVMSDLSLLRYAGFARLPEALSLRSLLEAQQGAYLINGIHLIIAQAADGSLIVGDSHHYDTADQPFADEAVYELILDEYRRVSGRPPPAVRERWMGTYATAAERSVLIDAPSPTVRLVVVTSGIGASTGFAIGEEVIDNLFNGPRHSTP